MASKVGIPFWAVVVCSGVMLLGVTEQGGLSGPKSGSLADSSQVFGQAYVL